MKRYTMLIILGLLNVLHGLFHIIQFVQSMILVYFSNTVHKDGIIDSILHSWIFSLSMGLIGLFTLIIGIKDYLHHKRCK